VNDATNSWTTRVHHKPILRLQLSLLQAKTHKLGHSIWLISVIISTSCIGVSHLIIETYICNTNLGMSELAILRYFDMTVYCHVAMEVKDRSNVSYWGVFFKVIR
jgi:hypothetical protein